MVLTPLFRMHSFRGQGLERKSSCGQSMSRFITAALFLLVCVKHNLASLSLLEPSEINLDIKQ